MTGIAVPLLLAPLFAAAAHANDAPAPAGVPGQPPEKAVEIMGSILSDNAAFVSGKGAEFFAPFKDAQHPRATVVMCADSRVHTHAFENTPDGDLFVIRNIGNQVLSNPGSVEYGIRHLHTPLLLIIGHVACGAVKAALGDYRGLSNAIREPLDRLHLALEGARKQQAEAQWRAGIEENVHYQVQEALTTYADEVKSGKLVVVGAVYDFQNAYGQGRGRLLLLNVNGERNPQKIPNTSLISAALSTPLAAQPVSPEPAGRDEPVTKVTAVNAERGGVIQVIFNEPLNPASVVPTSFAQRPFVPGTITVTNLRGEHELAAIETRGNVVTITPFEIIQGSTLKVTVTSGVTDRKGTHFPRPHTATVKTLP